MDYDFITTCNWTATGTYTLQAFRGSTTNVVTTYYASIFYRKKGTSTWTSLNSSGQMVVDSIGEWEVANDWNKNGNDCLTHSYWGIRAINKCTDVYFNETSLGATVGNNFLRSCWRGCTSLTSMPSGFNIPTGITSVGDSFLYYCWRDCTSLTSMPSGFNIPTGITTVGNNFLASCWQNCISLSSMPAGFNLPTGITSVGNYFLSTCWYDCTLLNADGYTENRDFPYSASNAFGGTCPITPNSPTAGSSVAVNRLLVIAPTVTTQSATDIATTSFTGNGNITDTGGENCTKRGFCYMEAKTRISVTKGPGTMSIVNRSGGDVNWINPDNAKVSDNTYSTVTLNNQSPHYLKATNFGFNIPENATNIKCYAVIEAKTANGEQTISTKQVKNGSILSLGSGKKINTTESTIEIDLLYVLTPSEVNNSNTGFVTYISSDITDTISVDSVKIKVEYDIPEGGTPTTADSKVEDSGTFGTGAFSKSITGLSAGTSYRVRAYAVNSAGTSYGTTVQVTTLSAFIPRTMWFN